MHRSPAAVVMILVAAVYLFITEGYDDGLPAQGEQGLCFPSPALWPIVRWLDAVGGIVLNGAMIALMALLNKDFNVLRSNTRLPLGLFALMATAVPRLVVNVSSGIILALAVNVCVFLLFSCYDDPSRVRRVFLSFLILSFGATIQYSFVIFIPVLWIMTAQMRIFTLRTALASLFGIATPWIILLGFGLVAPADIHFPEVTPIFSALEEDYAQYMLVVAGVTAFLLLVAIVLNLSRTIAYNARARAFNGALTLISLVSIVAVVCDYNSLMAYLPLLNVGAAYQITQLFVNHRFDRQFIAVLAVCFIYIAFYVWRMFL